jgi:DNA polymerase-3 subunit epsilon
MRQVILDTETTGLLTTEGHRIIEIGCFELVNRKLTGQSYHQYTNPQREIDPNAIAVHGITNEFLKDKPLFADIAEEFMAFINGAELIIHNAPFDIGFINYELSLLPNKPWKIVTDHCRVIDTLALARQMHAGQRNNLDALCRRYNVDNSQRELHGALIDVNLLTQVYLAMTGGQGTLFDDMPTSEEQSALEKTSAILSAEKRSGKLRVLQANEQECLAHEKRLKELGEKGERQWR